MKALSLWQPWAHLVAVGAKSYETRSWATEYRGWVAIHAAKHWTRELHRLATTHPVCWFWQQQEVHVFGAIVAVAELRACCQAEDIKAAIEYLWPSGRCEQELAFGDFSAGRFAWELGSVVRLNTPVFCRGRQGLWTLEVEPLREVTAQLTQIVQGVA